ncbi:MULTISPECIES: EAL domain-containing protein [unclassified Thermosynechococcus]|uniref:EAL domain-containing protein n=1 Tax=unclassified Thermosynechococcus TaxID=2622553 RepID=UPI0019DBF702|nr:MULTISPECIES: EAL domain-containing protein [unclassified Thermosynechococcus]HIK34545.1 EAL domain-containing protein [Thermosynechococcus sp. M98_K2018_005]HIK48063.1 EAL domain-containing protein [Thermosynechococcus sp. M55_K2018_012]
MKHYCVGTILLYPKHFIDIAEENGLIVAIGRWVLQQACRDCHTWQQQGLAGVGVAVNLWARQFLHMNLVEEHYRGYPSRPTNPVNSSRVAYPWGGDYAG